MIQQVNLLRHSSHGDNQLLKNPYFLTSIVVCVVLLTISVINYSNHSAQITRHQQLQQELQAASARLLEIQARFPSQTPDTTLQLALQQTQQRYQQEVLAELYLAPLEMQLQLLIQIAHL
jgi:Tfp pilus assembly protein PilN